MATDGVLDGSADAVGEAGPEDSGPLGKVGGETCHKLSIRHVRRAGVINQVSAGVELNDDGVARESGAWPTARAVETRGKPVGVVCGEPNLEASRVDFHVVVALGLRLTGE